MRLVIDPSGWPLLTCGRCSEVVVKTDLTVFDSTCIRQKALFVLDCDSPYSNILNTNIFQLRMLYISMDARNNLIQFCLNEH
jgi:hypothetical protein